MRTFSAIWIKQMLLSANISNWTEFLMQYEANFSYVNEILYLNHKFCLFSVTWNEFSVRSEIKSVVWSDFFIWYEYEANFQCVWRKILDLLYTVHYRAFLSYVTQFSCGNKRIFRREISLKRIFIAIFFCLLYIWGELIVIRNKILNHLNHICDLYIRYLKRNFRIEGKFSFKVKRIFRVIWSEIFYRGKPWIYRGLCSLTVVYRGEP